MRKLIVVLAAGVLALSACQTKKDTLSSAVNSQKSDQEIDPTTTAGVDEPSQADLETSGQNPSEKNANKEAETPDSTTTASVKPAKKQQVGPSPAKQMAAKKPGAINSTILAASYKAPPKDTIFTWRNNWATLPDIISYKVAGLVTLGGAEYVKMTSVGGLKETVNAYYDTKNFALKGYRDAANKAMVSYKPPEQRYRFPLKRGDQWVMNWRSYDHRQKKESTGGGKVQVLGAEMLKLPAGTFRAVKVKMPRPSGMPADMRHTIWFAPELGITVKEQITSRGLNWSQILEKVEHPDA